MNNDNPTNDVNDNGDELYGNLPETERQELLQQILEFERERQLLLQERAQLLLERQWQQMLLDQARLLREQQHLFQDDVDTRTVRVARRQQLPQRQAFETRKKLQIQFLCPWSNQILNPPILANNNKRSESVCLMGA